MPGSQDQWKNDEGKRTEPWFFVDLKKLLWRDKVGLYHHTGDNYVLQLNASQTGN